MTIVRLSSTELFVHSPAELSTELGEALAALGDVRFVVPASNLHGHLHMEQYRAAYPNAELFAAPGLAAKRKDLTFDGELADDPDPRWREDLDQTAFKGHRLLDEVVFLHRSSRSLIVGDTCFNIAGDAPFLTRLWAWGPRLKQRPGPTPLFRLGIRDKRAARASVDHVLAWDFDRIIVGHGDIVESGGREVFRNAWSWLPEAAE